MAGIRRAPRPVDEFFYRLDKRISEDLRLSWEARGLLIFLLGKPDHWIISVSHLIEQTKRSLRKGSGRDAVRAILGELVEAGYLQTETARNDGGQFGGVDYVVHEVPLYPQQVAGDEPKPDYPAPAEPKPDYPAPANPLLVKTERAVRTERAKKGTSAEAPIYAQASSSPSKSSSASSDTGHSSAATSAATSNNPISQASLSGVEPAVGKVEKKTGKAKATKGSLVTVGMLAIPEWLPVDRLQAFLDYRVDIKKPMTKHGAELLIGELTKLRAAGHDPVDSINRSIMSGKWLGVFPPRPNQTLGYKEKFNPHDYVNGYYNREEPSHAADDCIDVSAVRLD